MNLFRLALLLAPFAVATSAGAQRRAPVDVSLGYIAERANPLGATSNFRLQGGSAEVGISLWHGLGAATNLTGTHAGSLGPNSVPLTLTTLSAGPRYRYRHSFRGREVSVYGEALAGWAHGAGSIFPSSTGATTTASSLATHIGGGIDLGLSPHLGIRVLQASWLRTQLPNSGTNVQNTLSIGAGLVAKF